MKEYKHKVSAIISCYNSEKFIEGRLYDLLMQTIRDEMEIIVVISGSSENELHFINKIQKGYSNIEVIVTEDRETIYKAWNRGIAISKGKYITNANSDDRLRNDAYEIMSRELDKEDDVGLVYSDQYITSIPNIEYNSLKIYQKLNRFRWSGFSRTRLLEASLTSSQPMWRSQIHFKDGIWFDENLKVVGDYEFALRVAEKYKLKKIKKVLGVYYLSKQNENVEKKNYEETKNETYKVRDIYTDRYLTNINNESLYYEYKYYDFWVNRSVLLYYFWKLLYKIINDDKRLPTRDFAIWYASKIYAYLGLENKNQRLISRYKDSKAYIIQRRFKEINQNEKIPESFVSVILPTKDRPDLLNDAIDSLAKQTYINFEVIIIDNGIKKSESVVNSYKNVLNIKYIYTGLLKNVSIAKNIGLRKAIGDYIAYLDDDDWYHPTHIEDLLKCLQDKKCEFVYSDAFVELQEKVESKYRTIKSSVVYSKEYSRFLLYIKDYIFTPCVMHRKECINAVGYFDELLSTDEDHDYWIRMSRFYKFQHLKKVTCSVRRTNDKTSLTKDWSQMYLNKKYLIKKYYDVYKYNPIVRLGQFYYLILRKKRAKDQKYGSNNSYY